jgi:hypothetical protein
MARKKRQETKTDTRPLIDQLGTPEAIIAYLVSSPGLDLKKIGISFDTLESSVKDFVTERNARMEEVHHG